MVGSCSSHFVGVLLALDNGNVLEFARQGMVVASMVSMPILAVALFVGIAVSVFQAVTQVQEATLTYVPKLIGAGLIVALLGNWMLTQLVSFMRVCFDQATRIIQ